MRCWRAYWASLWRICRRADLFRRPQPAVSTTSPVVQFDSSSLWQVINLQRVRLYRMKLPGSYQTVLPQELEYFRDGVSAALQYVQLGQDDQLQRAVGLLARVNYELRSVKDQYLVLTEREPARRLGDLRVEPRTPATIY